MNSIKTTLASAWLMTLGALFVSAAAAQTTPETDPSMQPIGAEVSEPLQSDVNSRRSASNAPPTAPLGTPTDASGQVIDPTANTTQAPAADGNEPRPLTSLAGVDNDYKIAPNDLLEFDVFGVPEMQRNVRVNASGMVSLPLVGPVMVAGLTGQQAETLIAEKYASQYLQNPQVSLFIKEFTTQRITIEGAVQKPGIYPVTGQLSLLRALALAGGGAQYADLDDIMLYRNRLNGEREVLRFDLKKVRAGEILDPEVLADDVIVVKRDASRTALRDSLFRDIVDTINPFSK